MRNTRSGPTVYLEIKVSRYLEEGSKNDTTHSSVYRVRGGGMKGQTGFLFLLFYFFLTQQRKLYIRVHAYVYVCV